MVSRVVSFMSSQDFFDSYISPFSALLQTSLSKEPSETLNASTTFDFPVSVCNSNLFRVAGSLECLCCWRCPTSFYEGFWVFGLRSLDFFPRWVVKSPGEISFSFRGLWRFFFFFFFFFFFALWTSS